MKATRNDLYEGRKTVNRDLPWPRIAFIWPCSTLQPNEESFSIYFCVLQRHFSDFRRHAVASSHIQTGRLCYARTVIVSATAAKLVLASSQKQCDGRLRHAHLSGHSTAISIVQDAILVFTAVNSWSCFQQSSHLATQHTAAATATATATAAAVATT